MARNGKPKEGPSGGWIRVNPTWGTIYIESTELPLGRQPWLGDKDDMWQVLDPLCIYLYMEMPTLIMTGNA